ncbi:MAG: class I SAM-dependent methyltransferase [Spirochaetaceae bacterium]|nr:MAG: class I SAM-dependent methyltransferase [Spirochaetaceae bacterium]
MLSPHDEKARYLLHQNSIKDTGYVNFLEQAIEQARPYFREGSRALDFGCGPQPALSVLLGKAGLQCKNYDPFFFPDLPSGPFAFVFAVETFEHFFSPGKEIQRIRKLLKSSGILVVMTEKWISLEQISSWHYAHDMTHVIFYHDDTFRFIARKFELDLLQSGNPRVVLLRRHGQ